MRIQLVLQATMKPYATLFIQKEEEHKLEIFLEMKFDGTWNLYSFLLISYIKRPLTWRLQRISINIGIIVLITFIMFKHFGNTIFVFLDTYNLHELGQVISVSLSSVS